MGYEYGRKVHASIDTDSLSVMEWKKVKKDNPVHLREQKYFFNNHREFIELLNITGIPNFRTLSCLGL